MRRRRAKPHLNRTLAGGGHAGCIRRQLGAGIALVGRDTGIVTRSESSILGFDREPDNGLGGRARGAAVRGAAGRGGRLPLRAIRSALSGRGTLAIALAELRGLARRG